MNRYNRRQVFKKLAEEIQIAQKGVQTAGLLQQYRTSISKMLNSMLGSIPNLTIRFEPNAEPVDFLGGEVRRLGLKAFVGITTDQEKAYQLEQKLPQYLLSLFKPTEDAVRKEIAVFAYELKINNQIVSSGKTLA